MFANNIRLSVTRKLVVFLGAAVLLATAATEASAMRGRFGAAVMFRDDLDFGAQARWTRGPGEKVNLVPQVGYFFDAEALDADLDVHYTLNQKDPKTRLYILGGGNLVTDFDDSKFGLNLGAGLSKDLTTSLNGFVEVKYVVSDWDGLALHLGLSF